MTVRVIEEMLGKVITGYEGFEKGSDELTFDASNGKRFVFWYEPDCCGRCSIEDIVGDLRDLLNSPLVIAEEVTSYHDECDAPPNADSYTWTFYRFATIKGTVTVRWLGESNGYYSESVSFRVTEPLPPAPEPQSVVEVKFSVGKAGDGGAAQDKSPSAITADQERKLRAAITDLMKLDDHYRLLLDRRKRNVYLRNSTISNSLDNVMGGASHICAQLSRKSIAPIKPNEPPRQDRRTCSSNISWVQLYPRASTGCIL